MAGQRKDQNFQWTKVPIPFTGGVDTRTDRKVVPLPKLLLLENAVFSTPGSLRKRFGYQTLATDALDLGAPDYGIPITDARTLFTRANSLWLRAASGFYSLAVPRKRWNLEATIPNAALGFGPRFFLQAQQSILGAERATTNGITMVAHDVVGAVHNTIQLVFYDESGTELARTSFTGTHPRAVVAGTFICLFYASHPVPNTISLVYFQTQLLRSPNPLLSTTVAITADLNAGVPTFDADYDPTTESIILAWNSATATTVKIARYQSNGTQIGATASQVTAFAVASVACAVGPGSSPLVCLTWLMSGTPRVDGNVWPIALGAPSFASKILGTPAFGTGSPCVTCIWSTSLKAEIYFDYRVAAAVPDQYARVEHSSLDSTGTVTTHIGWLRHASIQSKPWLVGGKVYLVTGRPYQHVAGIAPPPPIPTQRTDFIVTGTLPNPLTVAAIYPNECDSFAVGLSGINRPFRPDVVGAVVWLTPRLMAASNARYAGNVAMNYDYSPQFVECGGATYVTGSSLWMCDGSTVVESGFLEYPEMDNSNRYVATSATGGSLVSGKSYSYRFYYEWTSATGEVFQSTFAEDVVVALSGGNDTITLQVPTLTHSAKVGTVIAAYRTLADGTVFYRVQTVANDPTVDFVTVTDTLADTDAQLNPIDYRSSAPPELSNLAPPAFTVLAVGNTRVFGSGLEDPNRVDASKLRGFGQALNWNPAVTMTLPEAQGQVTALCALGDSMLAFRRTHTYILGGDGPDNVGLNGAFVPPRIVTDDVGCTAGNAIVRMPLGVIFRSERGLYLLGADMSLGYIGADVEAYNTDPVMAASTLPDRHEARFCLATGRTLVFDYLARQWSVFTVGGIHAVIWQDRHTVLPDAGAGARAELNGSYLDDGQSYGWAWESAWIHVGENQNHQRVRTVQLLGEWMGDHSSTVWFAYNYELAWSDRIVFDVSAVINGEHYGDDIVYGGYVADYRGDYGGNVATGGGLVATSVYQVKVQPRRMRCQSIRVRWEEHRRIDPTGAVQYAWLEGARLTEIALEIGLRGGLWAPGIDRTFGSG